MKGSDPVRKGIILLVLVAALVVPAQAAAKSKPFRPYRGTVIPSGTLNFNLQTLPFGKHHKRKYVENFTFYAPMTCEDGAHTAYVYLLQSIRLKSGQFNINVTSPTGGATVQAHGNVGRTAASGTLSVSGTAVPIVDRPPSATGLATGTNCATGVLNWTAAR